jgi:hypothetical protein
MAEESIGGRATAATLEALPRDQWRVLHDVPWPGRPHAAIDHVVVGPAGVFVVDSKTWTGVVSVRDGVLRQDRYSRQGAVTQSAEASRAIARQLRTARSPVQPVLCLERNQQISVECDGVLVCTTANIAELMQSRPRVLAEVEVQRIAHDVAARALQRGVVKGASSRSTGRGVAYLLGALAALAVALVLVVRPDGAALEDLLRWAADGIEGLG